MLHLTGQSTRNLRVLWGNLRGKIDDISMHIIIQHEIEFGVGDIVSDQMENMVRATLKKECEG